MKKNKLQCNYSLYLVTDSGLSRGRSHEEVVTCAIRGGATIVQLREKECCTRDMIEMAGRLAAVCRSHKVPLIVNDRIDVALAADADGVHVGQGDMPVPLARRLIGPKRILGVTARTTKEALKAIEEGADYIGASPIFATSTKADAGAPIGLEGLKKICEKCGIPVVGISGINASNAESVIRAGAAGVAVVSAIVSAEDIEQAARELAHLVSVC